MKRKGVPIRSKGITIMLKYYVLEFNIICLLLLNSTKVWSISVDTLGCLSTKQITKVKTQPSFIKEAYTICLGEMSEKLTRMNLTDRQLRLVFVSVVAQAIAPYGKSDAVTLQQLLGEKTLNCASYALLTGHLAKIILDDNSALVYFVGFDGGSVGNHAQLFIKDDQQSLLLDPTIGLVAKIGFDELLSGKSVAVNNLHVFRQHYDRNMDVFIEKVLDAVLHGKYRPSDLLYYFSSIDDYVSFTNEIKKFWNGDINKLIQYFPTPAALALKKNVLTTRGKNSV
jgi:hypothetical protein